MESLLQAIAAAPPSAGATRVVAIDGRSGAGKTTLARALSARLAAPVVSLEDLYGGWDGLSRGVGLCESDVLGPLARGEAAAVPRYDWQAGAWARPWTLEPPAMLIVEGVGAGALELARHLSVLVWVELGAAARRTRALSRRGRDIDALQWRRWAEQEDRFFAAAGTRERADFVVDTSGHAR